MIIRVDISDHRLRVRMDPGKQPVIHLPVPPHPPGRNPHQWEERKVLKCSAIAELKMNKNTIKCMSFC